MSKLLPWNDPNGGRPVSELWAKPNAAKKNMKADIEDKKRAARMDAP
jgi:hypothetical protein